MKKLKWWQVALLVLLIWCFPISIIPIAIYFIYKKTRTASRKAVRNEWNQKIFGQNGANGGVNVTPSATNVPQPNNANPYRPTNVAVNNPAQQTNVRMNNPYQPTNVAVNNPYQSNNGVNPPVRPATPEAQRPASSSSLPEAYNGKEPFIFISYAHADTKEVLPIIKNLQANGFRVWYDAGIEAGTEWPQFIAEHLDAAACVIAFISEAAVESQNCRREINFAIELKKEMLAVYLKETELPLGMRMQLNTLQAMFKYRSENDAEFCKELCKAKIIETCRSGMPING